MKHLMFVLLLVLTSVLIACGGGGGGGENSNNGSQNDSNQGGVESFELSTIFANLADNIIIPSYSNFSQKAKSFAQADGPLASYCGSVGQEDEKANAVIVRNQWLDLMSAWQKTEMHQVGPVVAAASLLRNRIYSYGSVPFESCRVDRAVVVAEQTGFDINSRVFGSRGLAALEYLLFNENLTHTCSDDNINTATWNDRTELDRKHLRCDYAQILVNDIVSAAEEINLAWGSFRSDFVASENVSSTLEALSDALFYLEKDVKDGKLGAVLGIKDDACAELACPSQAESRYSRSSLENIRDNLAVFVALYNGSDGEGVEGMGFDDLIADKSMASVNTAFNQEAKAALELIDNMLATNKTLSADAQAIVDSGSDTACANSAANPESTQTVPSCSLHGLLKKLSDRLRTDFITIVGVDLPDRAQSDAD